MRYLRSLADNWAKGRIGKVSQVIVANGFNNLVSLAIMLHAARKLGPESFGELGLVLAVVTLGVVFLDSGVSVALVRNYNNTSDPETRKILVGGVLKAKVVQVLLIAVLAFPLAHLLRYFLPEMKSVDTLAAGIISAVLMSLWISIRSLEQARRNYSAFTRYIYLFGSLRVVIYAVTLALGRMSAMSVLLCLYLIPLSLLLVYTTVIRERAALGFSLSDLAHEGRALWAALKYGTWVAGSALFLTLASRLPLFFLARRSSLKQLGLYTAALTFVNGFGLIWDAVNTVVMPEVSALRSPEARLRFRGMLFRKLPLMFSVLAAGVFACILLQGVFLGPAYRGSISTFLVIGSATAICMCVSVNNNLVHAYGIPETLTYMNLARVVLLGIALVVCPRPDSLNVGIIYSVVLLAGDVGLYFHLWRRIGEDRATLRVAAAMAE